MVDINFWKKKKVLLTGHTGFKGSWMVMILKSLEADIHGFSLEANSAEDLFNYAELSNLLTSSTIGDIRDLEYFKSITESIKPEIVIHMAAQPLVRESYLNPSFTYETNVLGTLNVLEACRGIPSIQSIVVITTDKCYENKEWLWGYRETDQLGGYDPYSSSKACAEILVSSYRQSFFSSKNSPSISTVRAGNVIGGGDWSTDRLIPDIIRHVRMGKNIEIRNPKATRPWQHVIEPLFGYLKLAEKTSINKNLEGAWNFGPEDSNNLDVGSLTTKVLKEFNSSIEFNVPESKKDLHEAQLLKLDISKVKSQLGWKPKWSIDETIRLTTDWYIAFLHGENIYKKSMEQINNYYE